MSAEQQTMEIFIDRWGKEHTLTPEALRRGRRGIFAILISNDHILLSWPVNGSEVAELPGGGIEQGETHEQAILREIIEEAAVEFPSLSPLKSLEQTVKFYADCEQEYWDYEQTYWFISGPEIDAHYFEGERKPTDALKSKWLPLKDLDTIQLQAVHAKALKELRAS